MKQLNLLEAPVEKAFCHYLVPAISATLVTSIYILADTMMIGRGVGAIGMAALNILLPLFSLFFATGLLFGVGGGVLMSVSMGKGEEQQAKEYFTAAFIGVSCFAVFYLIACNVFFDPLTAFLGRNESMDAYVRGYGKFLVSGAPIFAFSSFLQAFVRNDKAPKLAMAAVISGGVTNVVLDYLLIFVIPMGMAGGAIATVIGSVVTVVILCTHFFSRHNTLRLVPIKSIRQIGEVFVNGLSSFIMDMSSGVIILLFNRQLLAYAGELGVVVYGVVSNSALVVTSICNGIGQAAQPLLATNCGAGKQDRVLKTKHYGEKTVAVAVAVLCILGMAMPDVLTTLFVEPTEEILSMASTAVRIYFLSFLGLGFNLLYSAYFQSIMKPFYALVICILRGFVLNGILVFLLPVIWGVNGIWATMVVTEALTLVICKTLEKKIH